MLFGGLQKVSLLDYPDKVSAVIFTLGCNFRCTYCHNPELVDPKRFLRALREEEVLGYLQKRSKTLDAVVISGGEPTLYPDLPLFLKKIKNLGFLIKLDTNGTLPRRLKDIFDQKSLDYVAMDIKSTPEKYNSVTERKVDLKNIEDSIKMIMRSGVPYEFRTTVVPRYFKKEDFKIIGEMIQGASRYFLQQFRPKHTLSLSEGEPVLDRRALETFRSVVLPYVKYCEIRGI